MKIILIFILFLSYLNATNIGNPHNINIQKNSDIKSAECLNCHVQLNRTSDTVSNSSLSCLSCHDGTIAQDRVVNFPGSGGFHATINYVQNSSDFLDVMPSALNFPTGVNMDITKGHPISIDYIEGVAGLKAKDTPVYGWSNASTINDLLKDGKIECVSCHNPHELKSGLYLKFEYEITKLCLTCHKM